MELAMLRRSKEPQILRQAAEKSQIFPTPTVLLQALIRRLATS
jgi:hypothetical protein